MVWEDGGREAPSYPIRGREGTEKRDRIPESIADELARWLHRERGRSLVRRQSRHFKWESIMLLDVGQILAIGAAGAGFLVWLFGGGFGLAILVFIVMKMVGK